MSDLLSNVKCSEYVESFVRISNGLYNKADSLSIESRHRVAARILAAHIVAVAIKKTIRNLD